MVVNSNQTVEKVDLPVIKLNIIAEKIYSNLSTYKYWISYAMCIYIYRYFAV